MQYRIREVTDGELQHHGIVGQRWGIRRFQYKDGSLTEAGRKRYGQIKTAVKNAYDKHKKKKEASEQKKREEHEKLKQRLLENGSPEEIKKNIRMFNGDEMESIRRRFASELAVKEQIDKLSKETKIPVSKMVDTKGNFKLTAPTIKQISGALKDSESSSMSAIKFYNNIAMVYNTFSSSSAQKMKIIPLKEEKQSQNNPPSGGS